VSVAGDGAEGLSMAKEQKPDIIISDILMPGMNGFEFCKHVKNDPNLRSIPVILLTSLSDPTDVISGLECGADNFIVKPYDEHQLLSRIRHILLSREFEETGRTTMGVEISFAGKRYFITSEKKQILDLLLSTYESAVQKNIELAKAQEELRKLNEGLEQRVQVRTRELTREMEERKKSEELTKSILENVDEGFIIVDRDFRILTANRAFAESVKMSIEDTIGKQCFEISHNHSASCFESGVDCAIRKVFDTGRPHSVIHKHYDDKRTPIHVASKAFPLFKDESGSVMTVIEIQIDVTEQKKLEDQLRHSQKMEAVGTLAGGIAHDFNNILNVILGFGTLVQDKLEAGSVARDQMNEVLSAADRAANLTRRLLAFSRKQLVDIKPVNVNQTILGIQKFLEQIIRESIVFKLSLSDKPLIVMADAGQIEQVIMNLATNARDAMPKGGRLTIDTRLGVMDDEYVTIYGFGKPGKYALITIADTGNGMDAETQDKIFDPFFTTKGIGEGTGLGLSISYGIIKQHNGYIKVYSEAKQGTVFKIYLPLIEEFVGADKKIEAPRVIKGGNETILIAEDEVSLRKLSKIILESSGYNVIVAVDGDDAIVKFMENQDKIQLVILDMIMPKKSGKEVSELIREKSPGTKVLFTSGYTTDIINTQEIRKLDFDFIHKPMPPQDLLKKVREMLDRKDG
jgi:PAS domain S-box-containing protein